MPVSLRAMAGMTGASIAWIGRPPGDLPRPVSFTLKWVSRAAAIPLRRVGLQVHALPCLLAIVLSGFHVQAMPDF